MHIYITLNKRFIDSIYRGYRCNLNSKSLHTAYTFLRKMYIWIFKYFINLYIYVVVYIILTYSLEHASTVSWVSIKRDAEVPDLKV